MKAEYGPPCAGPRKEVSCCRQPAVVFDRQPHPVRIRVLKGKYSDWSGGRTRNSPDSDNRLQRLLPVPGNPGTCPDVHRPGSFES